MNCVFEQEVTCTLDGAARGARVIWPVALAVFPFGIPFSYLVLRASGRPCRVVIAVGPGKLPGHGLTKRVACHTVGHSAVIF